MKIAITVGHSILKDGTCTSASGFVQEYAYCKELAPILASKLKNNGCNANTIVCPEKQFIKASDEKNFKLNLINGKKYDLVVELHLNAYNGNAKGTEVLYCSNRGKVYAQRINDKLDDIFTDRNIKYRNDLYILNGTDCAAVLVEAFFCDNKEDYNKADEVHEKDLIATKIAEGILGKTITENKPNTDNTFKNGDYTCRKAIVNTDVLRVRYNRGTNYDIIGKLNKGQKVTLNYCLNKWVSIEGFKGENGLGYVHTDYLDLI